ncbi:thiocillin/thiostrepton family thiazolyl peptide [Rhizobium ruizarguesonis]
MSTDKTTTSGQQNADDILNNDLDALEILEIEFSDFDEKRDELALAMKPFLAASCTTCTCTCSCCTSI